MNYLAHAYLSFEYEDILLGNMISDFVKGKKQFDYPESIRNGIVLHRQIDTFTDEHPATKTAKQLFHKDYRLYGGAFMDVVYDYFLANDKNEFIPGQLLAFSQKTYKSLEKNEGWMPDQFHRMFFYMKQQNWLYHYSTVKGIYQSFGGLVHRARYLQSSEAAEKIFESNMKLLETYYRHLWSDLKPFIQRQLTLLLQ